MAPHRKNRGIVMPRYDFTSQRLFFDEPLGEGKTLELDRAQANYLLNVLRLGSGDHVLLFNGKDGEWRADIVPEGRKKAALLVTHQTRLQTPAYDLHYLFAPIKQARLEYMVQKAVEMGAGILQPVITDFTQTRNLKTDRMVHYAIEAAEQCGILNLPAIHEAVPLPASVKALAGERNVIFCDEGAENQNPLQAIEVQREALTSKPLAILIGPEGGFSEAERSFLNGCDHVFSIPLGPRVLRADTAAVAALSIVQSTLGDWKDA